jgi:16S rRNA (cytidine1402-2'-O)-methyltransferase
VSGALVVVGTPIGNLGDLSPRAHEALERADVIACEDTRRTGSLLHHLAIERRDLVVCNEHTEGEVIPALLERIARGERVALVTDAGMPGVADPGAQLVAAAAAADVQIEVVPGPSAPLTALVASGLPTARFVFEGFLPRKGAARRERLAEVAAEQRTVILFESTPRLAQTLLDLAEVCGADRAAAVGRELTKLHEEVRRGTLTELASWAGAGLKGEAVVVLAPAPPPEPVNDATIDAALTAASSQGLSTRDAVTHVATLLEVSRSRIYDRWRHNTER